MWSFLRSVKSYSLYVYRATSFDSYRRSRFTPLDCFCQAHLKLHKKIMEKKQLCDLPAKPLAKPLGRSLSLSMSYLTSRVHVYHHVDAKISLWDYLTSIVDTASAPDRTKCFAYSYSYCIRCLLFQLLKSEKGIESEWILIWFLILVKVNVIFRSATSAKCAKCFPRLI